MKEDFSYGIIPCRCVHGHWEVYLVQLHAGHWGFPKGHSEEGELPFEAATRELFEETQLKPIRLFLDQPIAESYIFNQKNVRISKKVSYYLAEVEGVATIQPQEVKNGGWFTLEQLIDKMTFSEGKKIAKMVIEILSDTKS